MEIYSLGVKIRLGKFEGAGSLMPGDDDVLSSGPVQRMQKVNNMNDGD